MTPESTFTAFYRGSGIRAWLTCADGLCRWELSVADLKRGAYHQAETEVLLQPCGDDGLPIGGPVCLCRSTMPLIRFPGSETYWGNTEFPPGINSRLARHCYFRVHIQVDGEALAIAGQQAGPTSRRPT
jgi:hypothetical protein